MPTTLIFGASRGLGRAFTDSNNWGLIIVIGLMDRFHRMPPIMIAAGYV